MPNGYGYTERAFDYYYVYQLGSPGKMELRTVPDFPSREAIDNVFKGTRRVWMIGLYSNTNASIRLTVIPLLPSNYKAIYHQPYWGNQGQNLELTLLERQD